MQTLVQEAKENVEMNRTKSGYLRIMAVAAVLAVALIPAMRSSDAKKQPPIVAPAGADLANEDRVIGKYFDDLIAYQQECWEAKKRTALRGSDLDPLQRKSDDLKNRLSDVQNAIREVVRKLKAAGEWDDLDTKLLASTTDSARRSFFQESSFKADLEYAATNLSSQKDEISLPLDNLRKRVARATPGPYSEGKFAIVPAAYRPSMANMSFSCRLGAVRIKLIQKLGGNASCQTTDAVSCACNPQRGAVCTGNNCPSQATN